MKDIQGPKYIYIDRTDLKRAQSQEVGSYYFEPFDKEKSLMTDHDNESIKYVNTESPPILDFEVWAERWCQDMGHKFTSAEYFVAQAAFYAAHPGEGPISHTMEDPNERS